MAASPAVDTPAPHIARIFASRLGYYAVKVLPEDRNSITQLTVFRLEKTGNERVVWSRSIECYPKTVVVSEDGSLLLLDCGTSAVVTMSAGGKLTSSLRLEQLLTAEEIAKHTVKTVSSRIWRDSRTMFEWLDGHAIIKLSWGGCIDIDMQSGTVSRELTK